MMFRPSFPSWAKNPNNCSRCGQPGAACVCPRRRTYRTFFDHDILEDHQISSLPADEAYKRLLWLQFLAQDPPLVTVAPVPLPLWVRALPMTLLAAYIFAISVPQAIKGDVGIATSLAIGLGVGMGLAILENGAFYFALRFLGVGENREK